jgi:UDP-glucuronate 4-epimerase
MKVLITGVAGFIGSHLAERLLESGNEVYGVDNFDHFYSKDTKLKNLAIALKSPNFHFFEFDITKSDSFSVFNNEQFSVVFHLAAKAGVRPSIEAPEQYINTNITGTLHILEYMRSSKSSKLVFASSSSIYGNCKVIPFDEEVSVNEPISSYAFTKKSCELLNYNYHHLYNIDIVNLRFFTVYGPRQRPDLAIHKFLNKIKNNQPIEIFGDGTTSRDYTFIDDIISGVISAGEFVLSNTNVYEIINLGNHTPVKLIDLIATYRRLLKIDFQTIHKGMQEGDVDITYANIDKAKKILGYQPTTTFEEGLKKFIEWHNATYDAKATLV